MTCMYYTLYTIETNKSFTNYFPPKKGKIIWIHAEQVMKEIGILHPKLQLGILSYRAFSVQSPDQW